MYYQICISGTDEPIEEIAHLKELDEISYWISQNQKIKPEYGEDGFDEWVYMDDVKYIILPFTDDGIFMFKNGYYLDEE
jgi:hypothetical protein